MGLHGWKIIWELFVPHAHIDVQTKPLKARHTLVSTVFMLNAGHNQLTWFYNQKIVSHLQLGKLGTGLLILHTTLLC